MKKFSVIRFHASFAAVAVLAFILGEGRLFGMLLLVVTVHELAHILTAAFFHCKTEKIIFMALGEMAVIRELHFLRHDQRTLVLLAGPMLNIAMGFACTCLGQRTAAFQNACFTIGFFNLLPVYPLDGGRLLQMWLGGRRGVLNGNQTVFTIGKAASVVVIAAGITQVILYPFNISLLCMGLYLFMLNRKECFSATLSFYRNVLLTSGKADRNGMLPARLFAAKGNVEVMDVLRRINYDTYLLVEVFENGEMQYRLSETQVLWYVRSSGPHGTLEMVQKDGAGKIGM